MTSVRVAFLALVLSPIVVEAQVTASDVRVDSIFSRFAGTSTPGCAVGVSRDGRTLLSRAYGMADLEHERPNTPGTIFEAGSVTKQFTAAAVLLLAQDGTLSLDDDVRKLIPELPAYATPITLRHLLNHTSGLRDWGTVAAIGEWPRGSRTYTNAHVLAIARRQRTLNYPSGQYFAYTNTGYTLLAVVVERAARMTLPDFTRTRLFEPLGMASTSWRDDYTRVVKGRAVAYRPAGRGEFRMDMPFENAVGHGGLLTTTGDLLRWSDNLRTGQVGGPAFIREMHRQGRVNGGREIRYASGLFVTHYRGLPEVYHGGGTAGYRAAFARYPEQRLGVTVLCNAANADATTLAHQVADVYLNRAPEPRERPAMVEPALLETRAGLYRDTRTGVAVRLAMREGSLGAVGRGSLVAVSPRRFRAGDIALVFDEGQHAAFQLVDFDGEPVRYEPVADFTPAPTQLAEFAGTYHSDEAEVVLTFTVVNDQLVMRDLDGNAVPLEPTYLDAFDAGGRAIRFARGPGGRVTGLSLGTDRMWSMPFERR
jgi:CubicO group peptidase (beta-lactamase class C family)